MKKILGAFLTTFIFLPSFGSTSVDESPTKIENLDTTPTQEEHLSLQDIMNLTPEADPPSEASLKTHKKVSKNSQSKKLEKNTSY